MLDERYGEYSVKWHDDRNYVLVRHGEGNGGKPVEVILGYFSRLDMCMRELARRESDCEGSVSDWLVKYEEVLEELRRAF